MTVAHDAAVQDICDGARLSLSPSGAYLASWHDQIPRRGPVVLPISAFEEPVSNIGWYIQSISKASAVLWSEGDIAYIVPGDGPVRTFDPMSGALTIDRDTPLADMADHVGEAGLVDPDGPSWKSRIGSLEFQYRLMGQASWKGSIYSALMDRQSHQVVIDRPGAALIRTDVSERWVEQSFPVHDADGDLYLAGPGVVARWTGSEFGTALPSLHQPRPIIDASTGELLGAFDDRTALGLDGQGWNELLTGPMAGELDFIESATVASRADAKALRLVFTDQRSEVRVQTSDGDIHRIACPHPWDRHPPPAFVREQTPALVPARISVEDWGSSDRPLPVRLRTLPSGSRGIVLFWDGGPDATYAMGLGSAIEQRWLREGYDVVMIDGSGSRGIDLGSRLRDGGLDAVLTDAHDVARNIAQTIPIDTPIIVHGVSFGAIAAAETARTIAEARKDNSPALLLESPWLKHRDPATYADLPDRKINPFFAVQSELASFGYMRTPEGTGYADRMDQWRRGFTFDGPTLVIYGGLDPVAKPQDMWPSAVNAGQTHVLLVPGQEHTRVAGSPEARRAARDWLADLDHEIRQH